MLLFLENPKLRFLWAAENNHLDIAKEMLEKDPELVNVTDGDLYTPLHRASYENHREMAEVRDRLLIIDTF